MKVLGIESSCDETAAAIVDEHGRVFADVVASQVELHAQYGGVVPELASRAHLENVLPVIEGALAALPGGLDDIDAIAVTQGPGLVGALLTGISTAKALAFSRGLPIVGVDHLVSHLFAVDLVREGAPPLTPPLRPFVGLLASGGHTALYEAHAWDDVRLLGQTRDDAAGEAFDKAAKLLGLGYPGGPRIDALAARGRRDAVRFPRPLLGKSQLDFSFSGLKTALARHVELHGRPSDEEGLADLCASYQFVIADVLATKAIEACLRRDVPRLVLAGGVAANRGLRQRAVELAAPHGIAVSIPPLASCTDNAAMIAYVGAMKLASGARDDVGLSPYSRSATTKRGKFRETAVAR